MKPPHRYPPPRGLPAARKPVVWLALILAASPSLLPLGLILRFGVNMPFWDEWDPDFAGLQVKSHQQSLSIFDFTAQHGEHRVFVPRLVLFLVNRLTHWNAVANMLLGWVVVCVTSLCVLWLCLSTHAHDTDVAPDEKGRLTPAVAIRWFLCNLLIFTPTQHENWLWGFGLLNAFPGALTMATFVVIRSKLPLRARLGIALATASAAMFSVGNGILCYPLAGVLLAWSGSWENFKAKKWLLLAWGGGFLICIVLYMWGYREPVHPPGSHAYFAGFVPIIRYILAFLGNAFTLPTGLEPLTTASIIGTIMLGLYLVAMGYLVHAWLKRRDYELCRRGIVWLLVGAFAVLSALEASLFRAGLAIGQALSPRYTTFSMFLPISLVILIPMICDDLRRRSWAGPESSRAAAAIWIRIPAALGSALILVQLLSISPALAGCRATEMRRREGKAALLLINVLVDNPQLAELVYHTPGRCFDEARILNEMGYLHPRLMTTANANAIRDPADARADRVSAGKVERVWQSGPRQFNVSGWAVLPLIRRPADAVFLTYENERGEPIIFALSNARFRRPDIAQQQQVGDYEFSGWAASFAADRLPGYLEKLKINAWALDTDTGRAFRLDGDATFTPP